MQFYCHTNLFSGTKWINKRVCVSVCVFMYMYVCNLGRVC